MNMKLEKILIKLDIIKRPEIHAQHDSSHIHVESKLWKLIIGLLVLPLALIYLPLHFGAEINYPDLLMNQWWMFGWATFIILLIGIEYIKPTWDKIKNRKISINIFIVISVLSAYIYSFTILVSDYQGVIDESYTMFFDSVIEILILVYLGAFLEDIFTSKTQKGLDDILDLVSKKAIIRKNKKEIEVRTKDLKVGDIVIVKNGEKIPVDGIVIEGNCSIDESTFTGESIPVNKEKNSKVIGGTIIQGAIAFKVTYTLENSMISNIIKGIKTTREQKTRTTKIADRFSSFVLPVIFIASVSALIGWSIASGINVGIEVFITSLVVTCPMSFILLTPTASLVSGSVAAKKGIIYNSNDIFERVKKLDAIAFDKTGTLTKGELTVVDLKLYIKNPNILSILKSMESYSSHPVSKSITSYLNKEKIITELKTHEIVGSGLSSKYKNDNYYIGSLKYLKSIHPKFSENKDVIEKRNIGKLFVYFWNNKKILGHFEMEDEIKSTTINTIEKLKKWGVEIYMISGDNTSTANYVASKVGIDIENVYSNILPIQKADIVEELQNKGKYVAFVGDGINDAIALEKANIGIAIDGGSGTALNSSDIIIQKNKLFLILEALRVSRVTLFTIYFGIIAAVLYSISALTLAVSGLLVPAFAGLSMIINDTLPLLISSTLFRLRRNKYK